MIRSKTIRAAALTVGMLFAQTAWAASETPPAAAMVGPLVAGVCLLSRQDLVSHSKIGLAAAARLETLTRASQTEFNGEKARIEARAKALGAKRGSLPPAQLQAQGQALNQRFAALQAQAGVRARQIDDTHAMVAARMVDGAQPYIAAAFAAHGCGLLVAREAVLGGNLTNDLTPEVLVALDAKAAPLTFELEPAR